MEKRGEIRWDMLPTIETKNVQIKKINQKEKFED